MGVVSIQSDGGIKDGEVELKELLSSSSSPAPSAAPASAAGKCTLSVFHPTATPILGLTNLPSCRLSLVITHTYAS